MAWSCLVVDVFLYQPISYMVIPFPAMEDNFRVRVDKAFGSLASSSASLTSLWCLLDDEIPRNQRNTDEETSLQAPFPSYSFLDGLSEKEKSMQPPDYDKEWESRSSVALDSTLDFEVGDERRGNRLYMKTDLARDPRANRLREDAEAVKKMDALRVSEGKDNHSISLSLSAWVATEEALHVSSSDDGNPRSILKRKDNRVDFKSQKRVRFSSECCRDDDSNHEYRLPPDYMKNPLKYTRYTLDSGENSRAYMDFLNMIKSQKNSAIDLPKSVAFALKRKPSDTSMVEAESGPTPEGQRGVPVPLGIAAIDATGEEDCSMEEDESETYDVNVKRGRQYRTKTDSHKY